ncbi:MAG TPA: alpha/beta hydrolase-fold protein [Solirubrobacteraceae bacterium]|jgi:enterochelin esterase-like enzyme|nr:alpha/beta hydrolase-fold protein [Solirubrobacteraceae bacterium]
MSVARRTSRTQLWMDSLGEWSWPGRAAEAVESLPLPPSWVPALPPRLELVSAGAPATSVGRRSRANPRLLVLTGLLSALLAIAATLALDEPLKLERVLGLRAATPVAATSVQQSPPPVLPTLRRGDADAAGSTIDTASYSSAALGAPGLFHVYIPTGYASTAQRYPVLYLLHGNSQPASAFLELGLQERLDELIARHEIPPLIAVMIQGGPGANNWRGRYESYVLEVQRLVDQMLPTLATRAGRAIAGDSMGGYGAMNIALGNPRRFSVVESWLGFFNGLESELKAATPTIEHEGLHAYVYGGAADRIADPSEDAPFAARLRAAGASAHGVVYEGGHSMETLEAHLEHMLLYAGHALAENAAPKSAPPPAAAAAALVRAPASAARSATSGVR